ncbi:MAG: hypothetical protein ACTHNU_07340 [Gaiellales bacterium]
MQLNQITLRLAAAELRAAAPLRLDVGSQVVARLVSSPASGGKGLISLAGHLLEAQLPSGLAAGATLRLRVDRADPSQILVRIVADEAADHDHGAAAQRLAGDLAMRGDGDLLRGALEITGGTVWLPGGPAAEVAVDGDTGALGRAGEGAGEAAFVLHDPVLGAIEVRLQMASGSVRASVTTPPGTLTERATEALPELVQALEQATNRPAAAPVGERPASAAVPTSPQGAIDVRV